MYRPSRALVVAGAGVALLLAVAVQSAHGQDANSAFDPSIRSKFREPVTLASKDGVLEVRLIAKQSEIHLDTVA
jgi:hypothetical protein